MQELQTDARLDPTVTFSRPPSPYLTAPRRIFLTGATGFLGGFLLDELLRETPATVYCLVRAADDGAAQQRVRSQLESFGLWQEEWAARLVPVCGDLAQPRLGLSDSRWAELAGEIDAIYHNGAWVNALYPYSRLRAANVLGTGEIIRLAGAEQSKALHYISTLAIFLSDDHIQQPVDESRIPHFDPSLRGGYKQSKWAADALVREAGARGLPVTVHRPGRVMGHSVSGVNGNLSDLLCIILKVCIEAGCYPLVETQIDLTPVDYVSRGIVGLSRETEHSGHVYHYCHPQPVEWNALLARIAALGYQMEGLAYDEWRGAVNQAAAQPGASPALQQARLLLRAPIFLFAEAKPDFRADATRRALDPLTCPAIDERLLATYLDWFQAVDFLPQPAAIPVKVRQ